MGVNTDFDFCFVLLDENARVICLKTKKKNNLLLKCTERISQVKSGSNSIPKRGNTRGDLK